MTTQPLKGGRKRHPGHASAHPRQEDAGRQPHGHGHSRGQNKNPNAGARGRGGGGGQDRNRRWRPPQSHKSTGPRTTPTDPPPHSRQGRERTATKEKGGGRNPAHGDPHTTPQGTRPSLGMAGYRQSTRMNAHTKTLQPELPGCKPKSKHTHHKFRPLMAGRSPNLYPNTHTLDLSHKWRA